MVVIADDLGAWLVGRLADAALKKLTALVLGSEQDRALRKAAAAAVQDTVAEMNLSAEQATRLSEACLPQASARCAAGRVGDDAGRVAGGDSETTGRTG